MSKVRHIFLVIMKGLLSIASDMWHNQLVGGVLCPVKLRPILYRMTGNSIGKKNYLSPGLFLGPGPGRLHTGDCTFINYYCQFDLGDDIYIGSNCNIAMNVHFINGTHEMGGTDRRAGKGITKPIYVGDGTWIGADSIIMPGVHIGKGCIIGAGSLVTRDTDDNSIYLGRPAKKYRTLEE